jgi:hypothetical protein
MRCGRRRGVELAFERRRDRVVGGGVRPRTPGGGLAGAELGDDLLPHRRVVTDAVRVQAVDLQPGRFQPGVVAGDAILLEDVARRR